MGLASLQKEPTRFGKSTWRTAPTRKGWTRNHYAIEVLSLQPTSMDETIPIHAKDDKMPYISQAMMHRWILIHALWPLIGHEAFMWVTGMSLHPILAFGFYTAAFLINAIRQLHFLRALGHKYGFLDGDVHERDQIPDDSVDMVMRSLTLTAVIRPLMTVFLAYRSSQAPHTLSLWILVELGLYGIVLDFWFYWYHRCMHESEYLWKFHRTHHLTKHPNPLLSLFADSEQEVFDIVVIPFLAWGTLKLMGLPMGFYDWWICHQYIVFVELFGHSGVRTFCVPPSTNTWFLEYFGCELLIEDHDLHHRKGWKNSYNYGKQTRLWDKIFGTSCERIESKPQNVDFTHAATLPWF